MKTLVNRTTTFNPYGQYLHFDDDSVEFDAECRHTSDILTAESYNGVVRLTDDGRWIPGPGPRSHYDYESDLLDFRIGLTLVEIDSDGKHVYDYLVETPTGVIFHGDARTNNLLRVPAHWHIRRVAAEAVTLMCLGEDDGADFPADTTAEQWTWIRSINRISASVAIDDWTEQYDRGLIPATTWDEAPAPTESEADKVKRLATGYWENQVYACQSSIISAILDHPGCGDILGWNDVTNLYPDPDNMSVDELCDYIRDEMGEDWRDLVCYHHAFTGQATAQLVYHGADDKLISATDLEPSDLSDRDISELRDYIQNNASAQDIFEWWLVSEWLYEQLEAIGEPVVTNGANWWWGRTCTGQSVLLDGTLQRIAAKHTRYA